MNRNRIRGPHDAMGYREGDSLTISNQWASVTIVRAFITDGPNVYVLSGDMAGAYDALQDAISAAYLLLADYQKGRAD